MKRYLHNIVHAIFPAWINAPESECRPEPAELALRQHESNLQVAVHDWHTANMERINAEARMAAAKYRQQQAEQAIDYIDPLRKEKLAHKQDMENFSLAAAFDPKPYNQMQNKDSFNGY